MKKSFLVCALILVFSSVTAYGATGTVDKFVPSTGVKVKESSLAAKMENATKKATQKNKTNTQTTNKNTSSSYSGYSGYSNSSYNNNNGSSSYKYNTNSSYYGSGSNYQNNANKQVQQPKYKSDWT